uniref:Uncharacterized protein n=1 Tax=Rhizophora mucronata TaxID=61149 RepID=A0A2P2N766_RHIMU
MLIGCELHNEVVLSFL